MLIFGGKLLCIGPLTTSCESREVVDYPEPLPVDRHGSSDSPSGMTHIRTATSPDLPPEE
jgi:hypothetical protein